MCGIVAIISKRPSAGFMSGEVDAFKTMLLVDSLRGEDSTGIFGIENNGNVHIAKEASHSGTFLQSKEMAQIRGQMISNGWVLAGHNRKATRGEINDKNAHPFWKDDSVVLLHNGTFVGDHKKHADTEVDSEALAHLLAAHEPEEVETVFNKIDAAYATMWYDTRSKCFNVLRNSQRPLWFIDTEHCWFLASEPDFIEFALRREKLVPKNKDIPKFLADDNLMQCSIDNGKLKIASVPINIQKKVYHSTYVGKGSAVTDACAWQSDYDYHPPAQIGQDNHHSRPQQVQTNTVLQLLPKIEEKKEPVKESDFRIGDVMDAIIKDRGGDQSFLRYQNWQKVRESYQSNTPTFFLPKNIIPFNDQFILYGPVADDPDLIGVTIVKEDDFCKIISDKAARQIVKGQIDYISWRRNDAKASNDPQDWEGFGFVHVKQPEVAVTESVYA